MGSEDRKTVRQTEIGIIRQSVLGVTRQTDFRRVTRQIDCGRGQETDRLWPGSQDRLIEKNTVVGPQDRRTNRQILLGVTRQTNRQTDYWAILLHLI